MIFIRPDLEEPDLVPRFNLDTRRFQLSFDFSSEHCFAVLGWADKVIQQHADIMAFVQVFAHTTSVERLRCIEASLGESDPKRLMNEDDLEAIRLVNTAPSSLAMYQIMLERFTANIAAIMTVIADAPPGAVVIHCHAGKDRTGLVVALVLRLTGVSPEDIAQDYALSDLYLQSQYQEMLAQKTNLEQRSLLAAQFTSKPETMTNLLQHIEHQYGGVNAYLKSCGLRDQTLDRITQRMLEPKSAV